MQQQLALENFELNLQQMNKKFEPFKMILEKYADEKAFELKRIIEKIIEMNKKNIKNLEKEIESTYNENAKLNADVQTLQSQLTQVGECVAQLQSQIFGNYEEAVPPNKQYSNRNEIFSIKDRIKQ
ncbi:hypothetical protein RFI_27020 [Reticulomyxa filosa]|uniref:Uncharacterized protein n=1 Tax=Reticulomyxa filosa TaxID=46433 RepID=X6M8N9_RETFI|nr:hypothetical protein RFI_27020 [Reticulomyxa filosa]|eukprot:ETO10358.1 hypothetical protein RFI_27020 [Reticulomyxa filosa]